MILSAIHSDALPGILGAPPEILAALCGAALLAVTGLALVIDGGK
jgi:hypothetical protein